MVFAALKIKLAGCGRLLAVMGAHTTQNFASTNVHWERERQIEHKSQSISAQHQSSFPPLSI